MLDNFLKTNNSRLITFWKSPRVAQWRATLKKWRNQPYSGTVVLLLGTVCATLLILWLDSTMAQLPNPGLIYLPLVAMLAYHWDWRYAGVGTLFQLLCVYLFFIPPRGLKPLTPTGTAQLVTLAAVTIFVLAIVRLARQRRANAEQAAGHFAALNRVGTALASELDEERLLRMIAETARDLTGAGFAAFTLRPVNEFGQPIGPSEGHLFHLAAVTGVTKEQEALFRRMPLGGEGLLAPIFRHGVPVLVPDALQLIHRPDLIHTTDKRATLIETRDAARQVANDYSQGHLSKERLRSMGVPRGHPIVRSFLGVPLLDRAGNVLGGLLLGHAEPDKFTPEDEDVLMGLAAEAAVALENARLYTAAQTQAEELDAIFESITDGITLVDEKGKVLRENRTARSLRETLEKTQSGAPDSQSYDAEALLREMTEHALKDEPKQESLITLLDDPKDAREYTVNALPLRSGAEQQNGSTAAERGQSISSGAVVVWHDVTEARRLLRERQAHAETEARRALLQTVINELPSSVYLVRGYDARLVLANRATTEVWGTYWEPGRSMVEFLEANGVRLFHVDGRPMLPDEFATLRALRTGKPVRHHQEIIRHRDGTTLPVLVNAVAIDPRVLNSSRTGDGNGINGNNATSEPVAIVVHQDVTALKEAERLKDEFIGIAAHELRTPLAVVKGFAQMLIVQTARGKGPQLADWQDEAIHDIDQATTRLVELTEDLLDVTRLQAGRLELHIEPTDLAALTQRVVTRLQITTEKHTISFISMAEHIVAQVDPRRIEQVFGNLINNAVKYSPMGGEIEVTLCEDETHYNAILSISDQGIGIPAQQQARIFSRFMRADNAREHNIGGTGLGLYLCRELVERHGGRIWFESTEDKGSKFFVSLPLADL